MHHPSAVDADLVSVIILSFNSRDMLPRAVASVRAQSYQPIEIIIVDNASTDGTDTILDDFRLVATVVPLATNTGFARGMNAGYRHARGGFILPLNVDALLHPTFVETAVALLHAHPDVGVIAPEVVKIPPDAPERYWQNDYPSEGGVVALTPLMRVHVLDDNTADWRPSFKANGACPLIRHTLLTAMHETFGVAPFDPVFDTYGEDVDFAFKAWALGWRTMYARAVQAGHVRSYASPLELPDKRGRLRINLVAERYINVLRHVPPQHVPRVVQQGLRDDVRMAVGQWQQGDRQASVDVLVALLRVLRLLRSLLRFRRRHVTWSQIDFPQHVYCTHWQPASVEQPAEVAR